MVVKDSGTQLAVIGTEHTLHGAAFTDLGVYVLTVDTRNMVNGDEVELRAYTKTLSADAQEFLAYMATFAQQQGDGAAPGSEAYGETVKISIPIPSAFSVTFTLTQTLGTGRNFQWRVDTI